MTTMTLVCYISVFFAIGLTPSNTEKSLFTIQMPGHSPTKNDEYVAASFKAPTGYIVAFEPLAHADRVHHMILFGCGKPAFAKNKWIGHSSCGEGAEDILYAWAKNAPSLTLPQNVGFSIGHEYDGIKYFVLQVHYSQPFSGKVLDYSGITLHMVSEKPTYYASVYLFSSGEPIPPGLPQYQVNISCVHEVETELHPFAFRTHAHAMARVISAYFIHEGGNWTKIGKRNPQWPQLFEPIKDDIVIRKNDLMVASCRYDSSSKTNATNMGDTGHDEMCNFYMMYYYRPWFDNFPGQLRRQDGCGANMAPLEAAQMPVEGTTLLEPHPELEHVAHQSSRPFGIIEEASVERVGDAKFGHISGISFDKNGHVVVFHRASRIWNEQSFDKDNILRESSRISEATIYVLDFMTSSNPSIVAEYGRDIFYLPQGLFVDKKGFYYTTDAGAHQVAKHEIVEGELQALWKLGEKLKPGADRDHLCQPSAVAVDGEKVYISDGLCNKRILVVSSKDGSFLSWFKTAMLLPDFFFFPHDIVFSQDRLFLADHDNGEVQVLNTTGGVIDVFNSSHLNNICSIEVIGDHVYMLPDKRASREDLSPLTVYAGRIGRGLVEFTFEPQSMPFTKPHIIRACPDGNHIFIGEDGENDGRLRRFGIEKEQQMTTTSQPGPTVTLAPIVVLQKSTNALNALILMGLATICLCICVFVRHAGGTRRRVVNRTGFKPLPDEERLAEFSDSDDE